MTPDPKELDDRDLDEALEETFPASDPISPMHHERQDGEPDRETDGDA